MATLTMANPQPALNPSWDETIVPTLKKRLETESRILTKRLSTISVGEDPARPDSAQNGHRAISPSSSTNGDSHTPVGSYYQRPSAIPRPSFTRERPSVASSSTQGHDGDSTRKPGMKRQRTQSTPFPFEANGKPSEPPLPNGSSSVVASTSTVSTQRVQSSTAGRITPTPSRIPTVSSRNRSASQSSQHFVNPGKYSLPPNHKFPPSETASQSSETLPQSLGGKPSSASLAKQRLVDEPKPFTSDPSTKSIDTGSDEEQPFQHWYRGDVSRNGGVGEYRVGKRMEMLDIANYGHALGTSRRKRAYEEPILQSENVGRPRPRKRAESISSMERTSIYIDPQDDSGRVLDETPLTDIEAEETDHEYQRYHSESLARLRAALGYDQPSETQPSSNTSNISPQTTPFPTSSQIPTPTAQYPSSGIPQPSQSRKPSATQQRLPSSIPQPRSRSASINQQKTSSQPATTPTSPLSTNGSQSGSQQQRGRTKPTPSKVPVKQKSQKRSKSAGDALRSSPSGPTEPSSDPAAYEGLADAVPDTRTPIPKNGNWDDVILPTIARRMGIEYETEDPETAKRKRDEAAPFAPAPGTFGYDHTKYKAPQSSSEMEMTEFGQRPEPPNEEEAPPPEPVIVDPETKPHRPRRDTLPSAPPFSSYYPVPEVPTINRERQDMPQVAMQTGPGVDRPAVYVEEEKGAGCCKCVIM